MMLPETFDFLVTGWMILFILAALVVWIVLFAVLWGKYRRLSRRFNRILGSYGSRHNLEQIMQGYIADVRKIAGQYEDVTQQMVAISDLLAKCVQKVGIVRYNPFPDEMGGNQSFVIALLDFDNNGVLFSTIHNRESSYTYGKPVKNMESIYPLSEEEQEALRVACVNFLERG